MGAVAAPLCDCGCGTPLDGRRRQTRWVSDAHRMRAARHPIARLGEKPFVCPCCGDFVDRLDSFTGWCTTCTHDWRVAEGTVAA